MSAFETAVWNWYQEMVNRFTLEAGAVGDFIREEGLGGAAKRLFLRALGAIHESFEQVGIEKAKAKQAGEQNGQ